MLAFLHGTHSIRVKKKMCFLLFRSSQKSQNSGLTFIIEGLWDSSQAFNESCHDWA